MQFCMKCIELGGQRISNCYSILNAGNITTKVTYTEHEIIVSLSSRSNLKNSHIIRRLVLVS